MGRIYSRKPVRDTETASESMIDTTLINSTTAQNHKASNQINITTHFLSEQDGNNFFETKNHQN